MPDSVSIRTRGASLRPLRGAHWTLPTGIVLGLLAFQLVRVCKDSPYYGEVVGLTVIGCVVVWSNHVRLAPLTNPAAVLRVLGGSLKDLCLLLLITIVAGLPIWVITPAVSCITNRSKAAEVVLAGSTLRPEIEKNVRDLKGVSGSGRGVQFAPAGRAKAGFVTSDGVIVVMGEDPPVVFMFTPTLENDTVVWKCEGFPGRFAPAMCQRKDER